MLTSFSLPEEAKPQGHSPNPGLPLQQGTVHTTNPSDHGNTAVQDAAVGLTESPNII